ncbi:MAG: methyltransferase [Betaproteobacteria bacterium]|jgi:SAM-dependent methyltransferase
MDSATTRDDERATLDRLIRGFAISRMLRAVADIGLADRIGRGARRDLADLATECGVAPLPLLRILRALASFGVFDVDASSRVAHSSLSLLLRTDTPASLHYGARFWTAPGSWQAWGKLDAALAGGVPHEAAWGMERFAYLRGHPDEACAFDEFMAHFPDHRHEALAEAYDFSAVSRVVDVGGGNGEALRHILTRFTKARGVVFDREDVVARIAEEDRMEGRIEVEGGSFLEGVPARGDVYLLMRVLHNWSDADCARILRNCRAAIGSDGRLLICEQILDPDPSRGDPFLYLIDAQMMAMFGSARERSEAEYATLLAASGFAFRRTIRTASPVSIVEAFPA